VWSVLDASWHALRGQHSAGQRRGELVALAGQKQPGLWRCRTGTGRSRRPTSGGIGGDAEQQPDRADAADQPAHHQRITVPVGVSYTANVSLCVANKINTNHGAHARVVPTDVASCRLGSPGEAPASAALI
jgi:hypothetical protein